MSAPPFAEGRETYTHQTVSADLSTFPAISDGSQGGLWANVARDPQRGCPNPNRREPVDSVAGNSAFRLCEAGECQPGWSIAGNRAALFP